MSLEDLGNLGEMVSALAVVVSLIYLAIQIRQNTVQIRENSHFSKLLLQENFVACQERDIRGLLSNDEVFRIWRLGSTATEELPEEDRERYGLMLYSEMYRYHFMWQARTLEPLEHKRCLIQLDRVVTAPAFRSWWSRQRSGFAFDPEFVEVVDDRIRQMNSTQE